jgi:hypothetical protein
MADLVWWDRSLVASCALATADYCRDRLARAFLLSNDRGLTGQAIDCAKPEQEDHEYAKPEQEDHEYA